MTNKKKIPPKKFQDEDAEAKFVCLGEKTEKWSSADMIRFLAKHGGRGYEMDDEELEEFLMNHQEGV